MDEAALIPGLLPPGLGPIVAVEHACNGDGYENLDPAQEATAKSTWLANHTTTLAQQYAQHGRNWEVPSRQRAKQVALTTELGLVAAPAATPPDRS